MSIFLLILKIIGIILLSIISLLLIIIALILFVPIRYRIIANKFEDSDFYAEIKLTWLLHFINILIKYTDDLYYRVRVILIPIKKSDNLKKHKNNSKKTEPDPNDTKSIDERENISDKSVNEDISDNEISKNKEEIVSTSDLDENDDDNIKFDENKGIIYKIRFVLTKFFEFLFNIKEKLNEAYNTVVNIVKDIDYYINALKDERNKKVISLCLSQASSIINNIKPKVFNGNLTIGIDDPYTMGQILSIYGILFPIIHDKITINPVYDKEVIEGDLYIKGRISVFVLIRAAIKIYFNRDYKRMIKIFKK
ncbi:MAG: hypothetical protein MR930_02870 [Lachnospiraceae bacterium]|nr:hypothetical protein [Lachnospiraceae bacterium]